MTYNNGEEGPRHRPHGPGQNGLEQGVETHGDIDTGSIMSRGDFLAGVGAALVTAAVGRYGGDPEVVGRVAASTTDKAGDVVQGAIEEPVVLTEEEIAILMEVEQGLSEQFGDDMPNFEQLIEDAERREEMHEHGPDTIDYIGTAVFADGVRRLAAEKPITQKHIYGQLALVHMKRRKAREAGDQETLHHINEELAATLKFTSIIEGTVIVAEGMKMDIQRVYEAVNDNADLSLQDRVAITTELASMLAPLTTTVGASGMSSKECFKIISETRSLAERMVDDLVTRVAEESGVDPELAAEALDRMKGESPEDQAQTTKSAEEVARETELDKVEKSLTAIKGYLQSHISDKAGFPFFGDPPFLATVERFGFAKGMLWQSFIVGATPAVASLVDTNTQINKELMKLGIIDEENGSASKQSRDALKRNFGFVTGVVGRSVKNMGKLSNQDPNGLEHHIIESFANKANGIKDLFFAETIEAHGHHGEGSRFEEDRYEGFVDGVIANLRDNDIDFDIENRTALQENLEGYLLEDDYEGLVQYLENRGLDATTARTLMLAGKGVDDSIKESEGFDGKWNPLEVYKRATDISRMQGALGHSFTDVLNVFPFQSISMIFASPVFKEAFEKFDNLTDKIPNSVVAKIVNDAGKFGGITAFSSIADNLVGAREGFKLTDNPALALIAAILGGMLLPPGNMANVVTFPLNSENPDERYSVKEAKAQILTLHKKALAAGFVWAEILGILNDQVGGSLGFPQPKGAGDNFGGHGTDIKPGHDGNEEHSAGKELTRRQVFARLLSLGDEKGSDVPIALLDEVEGVMSRPDMTAEGINDALKPATRLELRKRLGRLLTHEAKEAENAGESTGARA